MPVLRQSPIRQTRPRFNIGITTGHDHGEASRWLDPCRHWAFEPAQSQFDNSLTKRKR